MIIAALDPALTAVAGAILTGGPIYAWISYRKAGPETESIAARTLIEVNEDLRKELDRKNKAIGSLEKRLEHMRAEMDALQQELVQLRTSPIP
jgi:phage shock protein A